MISEELYVFFESIDFERWYVDFWVDGMTDEQLKEFIESVKNTFEFKN